MNTRLTTLFILLAALTMSCRRSDRTGSGETRLPANEKSLAKPEAEYLAAGKSIAAEAQTVLAKNLMRALEKGGPGYALEFCNTKAISLTDSMAYVLHAGIRRVSDKPRNAGNQANETELAFIRSLKEKMAKGETPQPMVTETDGKMVGYFPIITNSMCLQCHGRKGVNINSSTLGIIQKLYPSDRATGYDTTELRGLWVIEMNKEI